MKHQTPALANVHVSIHGSGYAAGFNYKGDRYHVWFDPETLKIISGLGGPGKPVLYKNPTVGRNDPGYYETRRLDPGNGPNAPLIAEMWMQVKEGDMIAKAREAEEAKENRRLAEAAEEARVNRIKEAGVELYNAAKHYLAVFDRCGGSEAVAAQEFADARNGIRAAIARAEGFSLYNIENTPPSGDRPD